MNATSEEVHKLVIKPSELDETGTQTVARPPTRVAAVPSEPSAEQRMRIIEVSGALDFWDRPEEDVYTLADGEPV